MRVLKYISYASFGIVFPTLIFFTGKFYLDKHLNFEQGSIIIWTILVILISFSLILSCYALKKISKVEKQNEELKQILLDFKCQSENNHYESIEHMQHTRELFMEDN